MNNPILSNPPAPQATSNNIWDSNAAKGIVKAGNTYLVMKLVFGGTILILFGIGMIWMYIHFKKKQASYKLWDSVYDGKILNSQIKQERVTKNKSGGRRSSSVTTTTTNYVPYIYYEYTYNGKTYKSTNVSNTYIYFSSEYEAQDYIDVFNPDELAVHVNPRNPSNSYLEIRNETLPLFVPFIGLLLIGGGVFQIACSNNPLCKMFAAVNTAQSVFQRGGKKISQNQHYGVLPLKEKIH